MSDQQHIGETSSSSDEPQAQQVSPGAMLAAERQAKGWTVEYVASHLKLAVRQIHALEEDRYDALPSPMVIRGFIRIYAKMLGIDSTPLVAALPTDASPADAQIRPARTLATPFSESSLPLRGQHELPLARIAWLSFGALAIIVLFVALKYGHWESVKNSSLLQRLHIGGSTASTTITLATPVVDATEAGSVPVAVAESEKNTVPSEVATAPTSSTVTVAANAAAVPATAPVATIVPTNFSHPLQLTIRQDSWVEIRRADKSVMISRTLKAGATEFFNITEPMSMTVGNVAGVDATFRGKSLGLTSNAINNVARLDLK